MGKIIFASANKNSSDVTSSDENSSQKTGTLLLKKSQALGDGITLRVARKDVVKTRKKYRSNILERKFFVEFADAAGSANKAMFPEEFYDVFQQGDLIEFTGRIRGEWINLTSQDTVKVLDTARSAELGQCTVRVGYIAKEREDARGKYVYSFKGEVVDSDVDIAFPPETGIRIPTALIDDILSEAGLLLGYGTIQGVATYVPDGRLNIEMTSISSYTPDIEQRRAEIPMSQLDYKLNGVDFVIDGIHDYIAEDDLPFDCSPVLNKVKSKFQGTLIIVNQYRKRGRVFRENDQWQEKIKLTPIGKPVFDFTACDIEGLEKVGAEFVIDQKYRQLLREIKQNQRFQSVNDIKKRFDDEGVPITQEEIVKMFYHEGYDPECFEVLDAIATDRFVTKKDFIFLIEDDDGTTRYVWETPSVAAATYVFDGTLPKEELLGKLYITGRMDIRRSKDIQQDLGFLGFVIHQDYEAWAFRVKHLLGKSTSALFEKKN